MGGLRREDRRDLILGFITLFAMMMSHALAETARDALFLSRLPASQLPWAYLAIAGLVGVVVRGLTRVRTAMPDKRRLLVGTMVVAGAVDIALGLVAQDADARLLFGLYTWTGLVATVLILQLWLLLEDVVTVTQAKRIFGPVAAGGVLGALVGSAAAEALLMAETSATGLLVAAGAVLLVGSVLPLLWRTPAPAVGRATVRVPDKQEHGFRRLCGHLYLRRLLMLVLFSTIAFTIGDYLFKSVVAETIPTAELPSFFAKFYIVLNGAALFVQIFLSGWLLRAFGVGRALYVLPIAMLAAAVGFATVPLLLPVLLLKGADGSLRHSLHRTATEVLYLPLSQELRERYKGLIDGVGQRGGQALASLGILGAVALGATPWHLSLALIAAGVLWVGVLFGLRGTYLQLFRIGLRGGEVQGQGQSLEIDLHALEALLSGLNSEADEEVIAALDLLEGFDKVRVVPRLVLYHPSTAVKVRALAMFGQEGDRAFIPIAHRLLRSEESSIRVAALRALAKVEPTETLYPPFLDGSCPALHATALVGLLASRRDGAVGTTEVAGDLTVSELEDQLEALIQEGDPLLCTELAHAMRAHPDPLFVEPLLRLMHAREPEVRAAVAGAMEKQPNPRFFEALLPQLGDGLVRPFARRAFLAAGDDALHFLDQSLAPSFQLSTDVGSSLAGMPRAALKAGALIPRRVRRHIPRTLSRFPAEQVAPMLLRHMQTEEDGAVRYKMLRGLGRIRAQHPKLEIDTRAVKKLFRATLERVVHLLEFQMAVRTQHRDHPSLGAELIEASLEEKVANALERSFRFLGLLNPREDFALLWRGVRSKDAHSHAAAMELLEHVLTGAERTALLALLDRRPTAQRLAYAAQALSITFPPQTYPARLGAALHDRSEALRSLVAYHVAELGLTDLEPQLRDAKPDREGFVSEVMERALQALLGNRGVTGAA